MESDSPLLETDLAGDPIRQFRSWFEEAEAAQLPDHDAMTLATVSRRGQPSARIVLLRGIEEDALLFFTDYESRKARDLDQNPRAALVFFWSDQGRQVRLEGHVERAPVETSEAYFAQRARESRISAFLSHQSHPVSDRASLERRFHELEKEFDDKPIPRPERWGGYRFIPDAAEFWLRRPHRLHDRFRYERNGDGWSIQRLSP